MELSKEQMIAEKDANNYSREKLRWTFADGAIYEMSVNQYSYWPTYFGTGSVSASTVCSKGHTYTLHIKHEELRYRVSQFSGEPYGWISNADFALMCAHKRK